MSKATGVGSNPTTGARKLENIIKEVEFLAEKGFCEVVLTGIHIASYGKDLNGITLADVVCAVSKIDGISRIRLGSLEPRILTEDFIKKIANATSVKIKMVGNKYYKIRTLNFVQIKSIKNTYEYYLALGGRFE